MVGTASTAAIAATAIAQYTSTLPTVTIDPDASEHSLLLQFQGTDAPHPQIVQTEDACARTGSKRGRAHAYLYAVSFETPVENETDESAAPMEDVEPPATATQAP